LEGIAEETLARHCAAFPKRPIWSVRLDSGGVYQWKRDGEFHLWNPDSIAAIQEAVRKNDYVRYKEFAEMVNDQSKNPTTLRSLLKFRTQPSIAIEEVEPAQDIVKRFVTGAMSFGSISKGAHEWAFLLKHFFPPQQNSQDS